MTAPGPRDVAPSLMELAHSVEAVRFDLQDTRDGFAADVEDVCARFRMHLQECAEQMKEEMKRHIEGTMAQLGQRLHDEFQGHIAALRTETQLLGEQIGAVRNESLEVQTSVLPAISELKAHIVSTRGCSPEPPDSTTSYGLGALQGSTPPNCAEAKLAAQVRDLQEMDEELVCHVLSREEFTNREFNVMEESTLSHCHFMVEKALKDGCSERLQASEALAHNANRRVTALESNIECWRAFLTSQYSAVCQAELAEAGTRLTLIDQELRDELAVLVRTDEHMQRSTEVVESFVTQGQQTPHILNPASCKMEIQFARECREEHVRARSCLGQLEKNCERLQKGVAGVHAAQDCLRNLEVEGETISGSVTVESARFPILLEPSFMANTSTAPIR